MFERRLIEYKIWVNFKLIEVQAPTMLSTLFLKLNSEQILYPFKLEIFKVQ